ncbi:pentapeptide repeat-containing protein [Pseudomonas canadensis]|nr:pentapeptide repeat-containing protein [Pseudomonas canadensis]
MSQARKPPVKAVFPRKSTRTEAPAQTELSSVLSYAVLILYVLASVSSTKDSMLLMPNKGIQLPLVSVTVSVVGFYFLSPLIVLAGHLVTLRRLPKMFAGLNTLFPQNAADKLSRRTDLILLGCLLSAGPATLLYILTKFTAYQSGFMFVLQVAVLYCACHATRVRGRELLAGHFTKRTQKYTRWLRRGASWIFELWLLVCIDVIFLPASISPVLNLKIHTDWLNNEDGGTVAWVPHIEIDRSERLWNGPSVTDNELARYSGHADKKEYFMTREVALDIRSRNLRYLDVGMQVIPRIWAHNADLAGANFHMARLYGSVFVNTTLNGANFEMAALDGAMFMNIDLASTNFIQTSLKGSFWDNVTAKNSTFIKSDLSLASFYGASFDHVAFVGTSLQAITLFQARGDTLTFFTPEPFQVLSLEESDDWLRRGASIFEVNPKSALGAVKAHVCTPKIQPGWSYAWGQFVQTRLIRASTEPDVVKALQELLASDKCKDLPDRGYREDAVALLAAAADAEVDQERIGGGTSGDANELDHPESPAKPKQVEKPPIPHSSPSGA